MASWLGLQLIHESGHVLGAYATGGSVERVAFHPLQLSRTDVADNPHPLIVAWAGPIGGVVIPLLGWALVARAQASLAFLARFFSAFCLVANGTYIGLAAFENVGDAATLIALGCPKAFLLGFAVLAVPPGFFLWHSQGRYFGLGPGARPVSAPAIAVATSSSIVLIAIGLMLGRFD